MKRKRLKLRWKMITMLLLLVLVIPFGFSFARYVSTTFKLHQNRSSEFYFTSDILDDTNEKMDIFNQDGQTFSIYLYNYDYDKNNNVYVTDKNINYTITLSGLNTVTLSSTSGTIQSTNGKNYARIDVTIPNSYTDKSEFTITASSTSPYTKTISKTFVLNKKRTGNSYIIKDTIGSIYATLTIKTVDAISKDSLTFDWTASTSNGIDLDTSNKYLINSDYSIPSTISNKISTNKVVIDAQSQIEIIIFKQDKSEYFGTGVEQAITGNRIDITKKN